MFEAARAIKSWFGECAKVSSYIRDALVEASAKKITSFEGIFTWQLVTTDNSFRKQSSLLVDSSWTSSCTTLSEAWETLGNALNFFDT